MNSLKFNVVSQQNKEIHITPRKLVNAGFTGKDRDAVLAHVEELKEKGIPSPDDVPVFYLKSPLLITQSKEIYTLDETDNTGEAEYVIFFQDGKSYISIGSDHTDRVVEKLYIPKAKQMYPNIIARDAWDFAEVENHWDQIFLKCWVSVDGEKKLFQETSVNTFLDPQDLVSRVKDLLKNPSDTDGLFLFSGTVASKFQIDFSPLYIMELEDKKLNRRIVTEYSCVPLESWLA